MKLHDCLLILQSSSMCSVYSGCDRSQLFITSCPLQLLEFFFFFAISPIRMSISSLYLPLFSQCDCLCNEYECGNLLLHLLSFLFAVCLTHQDFYHLITFLISLILICSIINVDFFFISVLNFAYFISIIQYKAQGPFKVEFY